MILSEIMAAQKILFPYFTNSLYGLKTDSFEFDIDILKDSFSEFSRLFT